MTPEQFAQKVGLLSKLEPEKVAYLAYYFFRQSQQTTFSLDDVEHWFASLNYSRPNRSRLKDKLFAAGICVYAADRSKMRLHAKTLARLDIELPELAETSEEIITSGSILPISLMKPTRGYIERLASQINASFENNIFDGCAVLMRRLLEILLIHTYASHKIESQIQITGDQYKELKLIIADAVQNSTIGLSRGTKEVLDEFRVLGNFSAHKLIYNCRREEIKKIAREYRATVEELLYKGDIKR
jgi:hypothetical protein